MEMVRRGSAKIHSAEKAFTAKAVTRMRSITTQGVVSKTTGAVSKLGKGAASITVDATKMAMNKSLEVGKSGIAMTMDVARNAQQVALAAGSGSAGSWLWLRLRLRFRLRLRLRFRLRLRLWL